VSSVALATQRMGAFGTSSSSRLSAMPQERPSIRAPGSSTDVAWDRTQLASGESRRRWFVPAAIGVALASSIVGAIAVVKFHPFAPHPATPTTQPTQAVDTAPLPTVRDPISPPLVSGVDRPIPSSFLPTVTPTITPTITTGIATGVGTHPTATPRHDAGGHVVVTPNATATGGDLPSTRN
jgi:hypothetical protein